MYIVFVDGQKKTTVCAGLSSGSIGIYDECDDRDDRELSVTAPDL